MEDEQQPLAQEGEYLAIRQAATRLKVSRNTVYNYMTDLNIEPKKFLRDRQSYISAEDIERIRAEIQARSQGVRPGN